MQQQDGSVGSAVRGRSVPGAGGDAAHSAPKPGSTAAASAPSATTAMPRPGDRLPRCLQGMRGHPWISDALLTVMTVCIVVGGALAHPQDRAVVGHPDALNMTVAVLTCLPLMARCRHPLLVLALTTAGQFLYLAADGRDGSIFTPTLVAMYTVASRSFLKRSFAIASAVAVAHTVLRLSVLGSSFLKPENYLSVVWLYLPVAIGEAVRAKRAYWTEVQARLARADREREEEARRRVTAERMRIARELHDVVAHSIAMINIQAGVAAHVIEQDTGQAKQALVHIKDASRDALAELRTTLGVLRQDGDSDTPTEPTPGAEGIGSLVASYRTAGLPVRLDVSGARRTLPAPVGLALYRIVQESLTNAVKHAGSDAQAVVRIRYAPEAVEVGVTDDGVGAADGQSADGGDGTGHGLLGMRERATAVGGTLRAGPCEPGPGFAVHAVLPTETPSPASGEAAAQRKTTEGNRWSGC
ncbi:sensor histidine kinase [Yinghuangia sp. ASG 101]|uniref:sensor histidine kinase n=1 Tax=Yinghuangia sp. ASG 101 TaxID=2896848 RepID=UPI001E45F247|nr:sensor histidine kinase [Yinghuangia sp. ASG 101]UGQ08907.1 sensor histidine kinase [Yinghuangia sp. ASG 101]